VGREHSPDQKERISEAVSRRSARQARKKGPELVREKETLAAFQPEGVGSAGKKKAKKGKEGKRSRKRSTRLD